MERGLGNESAVIWTWWTGKGVFVELIQSKSTLKKKQKKGRGHPDLNQGPLDLQSNALPLSYTPNRWYSFVSAWLYWCTSLSPQFTSMFDAGELAVLAEALCDVKAFLDRNMQFLTTVPAESSKYARFIALWVSCWWYSFLQDTLFSWEHAPENASIYETRGNAHWQPFTGTTIITE